LDRVSSVMNVQAAFDNFSWVGDDEPGCKGRFYPTDEIWPGAPANSFACRRQFQAMLSLADSKIGALVGALKVDAKPCVNHFVVLLILGSPRLPVRRKACGTTR
jgi:hypothetical protein